MGRAGRGQARGERRRLSGKKAKKGKKGKGKGNGKKPHIKTIDGVNPGGWLDGAQGSGEWDEDLQAIDDVTGDYVHDPFIDDVTGDYVDCLEVFVPLPGALSTVEPATRVHAVNSFDVRLLAVAFAFAFFAFLGFLAGQAAAGAGLRQQLPH